MLLVGLSFVLYDILTSGTPDILRVAWSFGITSALCYLFYRFGLFGGADAKSLICIAVIFPVHPQFTILSQQFPIYGGGPAVFPPAVAGILYGSFLALVVPIFLLFHNLRKSGIKAVLSSTGRAFLGYRVPLDQLAACRNVKLMDVYQESNGSVRRRFSLGGIRVDAASLEMLQRYHREGQIREEVWVTLDLPFLVFITCGFVIATFLGQPVTIFLS